MDDNFHEKLNDPLHTKIDVKIEENEYDVKNEPEVINENIVENVSEKETQNPPLNEHKPRTQKLIQVHSDESCEKSDFNVEEEHQLLIEFLQKDASGCDYSPEKTKAKRVRKASKM